MDLFEPLFNRTNGSLFLDKEVFAKEHALIYPTNLSLESSQNIDSGVDETFAIPKTLMNIQVNFNNTKKRFKPDDPKKIVLNFNEEPWTSVGEANMLFNRCEYNNCEMTTDRSNLKTASAILFNYCHSNMGFHPPITKEERSPDQAWIFRCLETPVHFSFDDYKQEAWLGMLNWSISYRLDSDIPQTYGTLVTRRQPLYKDYRAIFRSKNRTALWMVSNCYVQSQRLEYINELKSHGFEVDVYGECGKGFLTNEQFLELLPQYRYYLSFENSLCNDYITEKFFQRYNHDWITVVRGGADYKRLIPTNTYVDAADFPQAKQLAEYLKTLAIDEERYVSLLKEKDKYEGIFRLTVHHMFCNMCRRLNNLDDYRKSYVNVRDHVENGQCRMPIDVINPHSKNMYRNSERTFYKT
ncbi:hypothetical protein DPMN_093020 [Dreissena polymorpha]|uniref:Fucosyltransferase n=2 Tax=Dreissena polymorpha TaxID=45954 RepID=A0A9D4L2N4_DREPO|nr:hypothetical protein DPMN_093020 [Dreissena polymorpha]